MQAFTPEAVFTYNRIRKLRFSIITIASASLVALFLASYFIFLNKLDIGLVNAIEALAAHVRYHFANATTLGILYASLFGGLFFVFLPLEAFFIAFVRQGANPYTAAALYVGGFLVSFTINYFVGQRLGGLTKKLIGPKSFYKTKGILNKHGTLGVFLINLIPLAPAQPLSALLGIFNYNKTKFYVYFATGQAVKYLALGVLYTQLLG